MGILRVVRTALPVLALAAGLGMASGQARAETIADALAAAYENSGLLEQNRALLRAADENVAQALSALRPIISWSATLSRTFGVSASSTTAFVARGSIDQSASLGLSAQLVVYDGGSNRLGVEIAKETVLATRQQLLALEQQVLLRAANAYLEVRRAEEFLSLRQNNNRLITQELRAARDRFEVGEVTRTDVSLAEARLAAARSGLAAAQGDLAQAQLEYVAATGRRPGNLAPASRLGRLPGSVQEATNIAMRQHPSMLQAQKEAVVADLRVNLADAALNPTVTLSGRLGASETFGSQAYSRSGAITLESTQTIYAGGRLSSLQRQAMQNRDASRANLHVVSQEIQQSVGNAIALIQVLRASAQSSAQQVEASDLAFRGVREEATLGARTTLDVLNAEQELLNARANLISAQVDELAAGYSLLAAMGELTAQKLKLQVRIYDPAGYYNMIKDAPAGLSKQGQKLDRVLRKIGND